MKDSKSLLKILDSPYLEKIFNEGDIENFHWITNNFFIEYDYKEISNISIINNSLVDESCLLRGKIVISENVKIGRNVRMIGNIFIDKNVVIPDDCFIRGNCFLGESSKLGRSVELKDAIILNNSMIGPLSFIGDSLIGSKCFLGALVRTSNLRLDEKNIFLRIDDWHIKMGLNFGSIIGTNSVIGLQTSIMPGRAIYKSSKIAPNSIFISHAKK